ncbi:MAG: serine hydrolase [Alphaproteobacteria bacterium]|nr:serine hydrolase [Alphaproteobacteria bacterium]
MVKARAVRVTRRTAMLGAAAGAAAGGLVPRGAFAATPGMADFERAAAYSRDRGGVSLLAAIGGEVVFERYENGTDPQKPVHMHSATKSFWGVAAAAMVEDGLLAIDEPATQTLPEWKADPVRARITLRHLLNLSSGLKEDIPKLQGNRRRETWAPDKYAYAITLPCESEPGSTFRYGPSHFYALGEIFKRKLASRGQDPLAYLEARILRPIGLEYGEWVRDDAGNPHIPNGCFITARNWLKLGELVRLEGEWEGRQIVPRDLLAACFAPSTANPGYGLTWWLNFQNGFGTTDMQAPPPGAKGGFQYHGGYTDLAGALGAGRNGLYVIPSLDLVIVRQIDLESLSDEDRRASQSPGRRFSEAGFFAALFDGA